MAERVIVLLSRNAQRRSEMSVSLKVAAGRFLKWNKKGQEVARPIRGEFIGHNTETGKCVACKIGLVMIGRYGLNKATGGGGSSEDLDLRRQTQRYGPDIECPVRSCHDYEYLRGEWSPLGMVTEHLFELHKWSVNRIDKWLEEIAND